MTVPRQDPSLIRLRALPVGHEQCSVHATDQDADGVGLLYDRDRQAVVDTRVWAEAGKARWPLGVRAIGSA